jgi:hypothetical protein
MASKPVEQLANHFSVDCLFAGDYLHILQKKLELNMLPYQIIVDAIFERGYTELPAPAQAAEDIKTKLVDIQKKLDVKTAKQKSALKPKKSNKHPYHSQSTWHDRQMLGYATLFDVERSVPSGLEPGVERHSILDEKRVSPDRLDHCIHGVPKGILCASCNPEEFKKMTGIE